MNALQARKALLVATVQVQRAQVLADVRRTESMARRAADQTRQRLHWVAITTVGLGLVAMFSKSRRSDEPTQNGRAGLFQRALRLLRLAAALWISNRAGIKI